LTNKRRKHHQYGEAPPKYNPDEELSWMNYSGLLDMEVEFISDLG